MRILIADSQSLFADGLKANLEQKGHTCHHLSSFKEAKNLPLKDFSLWIFDPMLPDFNSERDISVFKKFPGKSVLCTQTPTPGMPLLAREHGFSGFLTKTMPKDEILSAIESIIEGKPYFQSVSVGFSPASSDISRSSRKLTSRQKEVLSFLCLGCSNKMIAYHMSVSEATVKLHVNALLRNLNVSNRTQAVLAAHHIGLIKSSI